MENLETEFKDYLSGLLNRMPKPENNTTFAPGAIKYGHYLREFNREAGKKLDEISTEVRDQPEEWQRLSGILSEYRTKLMTGQF